MSMEMKTTKITLALGFAAAVLLLPVASASAVERTSAPTDQDYADCGQSNDAARSIAACTHVIDNGLAAAADRAAAYLYRGNAHALNDDLDSAIADYGKAIEIDPQSVLAYSSRALAHARKGDSDDAIRDFRLGLAIDSDKILEMTADNPELRQLGALSVTAPSGRLGLQFDLEKAGVVVGAVDENGPAKSAGLEPGDEVIEYDGKRVKERDEFARMVSISRIGSTIPVIVLRQERKVKIEVQIGRAAAPTGYDAMERRETTLNPTARSCVTVNDRNIAACNLLLKSRIYQGQLLADIYFRRGYARYFKQQYDEALSDFDESIKIFSNLAGVYYFRGLTYLAKNDPDRAIVDFNESIHLAPFAQYYVARGDAYFEKKDYGRALADFDEALKLDPTNKDAISNRDLARSKCGQECNSATSNGN